MKELFEGALSKHPVEIKLTPNAVWGQNKNSGLLNEYASMIETTGISLNHEIVVYSGSMASNERRGARPWLSPPVGVIYLLCEGISINKSDRERM